MAKQRILIPHLQNHWTTCDETWHYKLSPMQNFTSVNRHGSSRRIPSLPLKISKKQKQNTFDGLYSRTSRNKKRRTILDFNETRDDGSFSGISWTVCKSFAPHFTTAPHHLTFTGRMLFLKPNEQCQSTEGSKLKIYVNFSHFLIQQPMSALAESLMFPCMDQTSI